MNYEVLSPWAEIDYSKLSGLSTRLERMNGKTIGLFADFMAISTYMLRTIEEELKKRYPDIQFKFIEYKKETAEIFKDTQFDPVFKDWIKECDAVISAYGVVPSSSLFLGYNAAYMESLGKPTVMLLNKRTQSAGNRGIKARNYPNLRTIVYDFKGSADIVRGHVTQEICRASMAGDIVQMTDDIVRALTSPLSDEEKTPTIPSQALAKNTLTGTYDELSKVFYQHGWTNGQPIAMPTEEAVLEMLRGTELPKDHVVAQIPPMMGLATVEKIAINAVMAGCLPIYLPVLIAAVKGALDERIFFEGWCCSQSTWGPVVTVSGPVVNDIGINTKDNALSPYYKANSVIGRAFGYILMNIGGLRPGVEDLSEMGHEFRVGFCLGDNYDENPWGPVHQDFGLRKEDSAVTMFWPQEHRVFQKNSIPDFLRAICKINPLGWEPGLMLIYTPIAAKMFADAGWSKQRVHAYIVEYARQPYADVDIPWLVGNNHYPETVSLTECAEHTSRIFWNSKHMLSIVAGGHAGSMITVYAGGGDHGGPSVTKIELPDKWDALKKEYSTWVPDYIKY